MFATPITYKTREEWLQHRGNKIGGSDIAAILGLNKYCSPYQLWRLKTGRDAPPEENDFMLSGRFLEQAVSDWFEYESNHRVIKASEGDIIYDHPEYDYMVASPDRRVFLNGSQKNDDRAILEIKTTMKDIDPDDIPPEWFIQPTYYAGIVGYKTIIVAWYDRVRNKFNWKEYPFDNELYQYIIDEAAAFWNNYIVTDIAPEATTEDDIKTMFPQHEEGKTIVASDEVLETYGKAIGLKRQKSEIEKEYKDTTERLKLVMRDAEKLITEQRETLATFKTGARGRTFLLKEV